LFFLRNIKEINTYFTPNNKVSIMKYKMANWLTYSVLVGLIPFISRVIIYLILQSKTSSFLFNEMDFISLGLVLHITNINELEHFKRPRRVCKIFCVSRICHFGIRFSKIMDI
jgi:hypothetical protein